MSNTKISKLQIFLNGLIKENPVLVLVLGTCPTLAISTSVVAAFGMGIAATVVLICSNMAISALRKVIPDSVRIPCYIVLVAGFVTIVEMVLEAYAYSLYKSLGVYLPLITTNCAVLGVTMNNISDGYTFWESMVCALGCGLGYLLAMVIFSGVRSRVDESTPSPAFDGLPITLVAAAIVSLSFFGFSGVITNLFG